MTTPASIRALRRANPRARADFAQSVEAAAAVVRAQLVSTAVDRAHLHGATSRPRRRLVHVSAVGATLVVAAAVAAALTVGAPSGPRVESATAAVRRSATLTAASAERSGTAIVRITHEGELWAGSSISWHGADVAVSRDAPTRSGRAGSELLLVDGILYGVDPGEGGWIVLGSPQSIDPGSGTTPDEYLTAVREDVGGATLQRITEGMTKLTTTRRGDGSSVYKGTVAAGLIARKSSFKGGRPIRVLPFGYVAHDEAADPTAPLDVAVTVGSDGVFREITVAWGSVSAWTYTVAYSGLGTTPAPVAPANARPLRDRSPAGEPRVPPWPPSAASTRR